jgi:hypothetical protein
MAELKKAQFIAVRMSVVKAEIRNGQIPNTSSERKMRG